MIVKRYTNCYQLANSSRSIHDGQRTMHSFFSTILPDLGAAPTWRHGGRSVAVARADKSSSVVVVRVAAVVSDPHILTELILVYNCSSIGSIRSVGEYHWFVTVKSIECVHKITIQLIFF